MLGKKISHKLIFAIGCVATPAIAFFSYIIITSHSDELLAQVRHSTNQLSETIKSSTKYDMLLNHRKSVHRIIDTISHQQGIEKIRIYNKEGEIIYSPDPAEIDQAVDKRAEACYACHTANQPLERLSISERSRIFRGKDNLRRMGVINPIYNEPRCSQSSCHAHDADQKVLGVIDITVSLDEVDQELAQTRFRFLLFAVSIFILGSGILWIVLQRLVGRPVGELVHATERVAHGDLNHRAPQRTKDELGELANSFNQMTAKLADARQQIYQQDKLASLGRLASGIAHEINNPLTGILTYSSMLLKRTPQTATSETAEDLGVIVRETKRCREIIKNLLDFARQMPPDKKLIAINGLIDRTLEIALKHNALPGVTVEKQLAQSLPAVRADEGQILQVLLNLVVNALDAMEAKGGILTIVSRFEPHTEGAGEVVISVSDTGCGIATENKGKVFEPFYSTKGEKGTGLGLSVAWGIIDSHGGRISVESKLGHGTVFSVFLPANTGLESKPS